MIDDGLFRVTLAVFGGYQSTEVKKARAHFNCEGTLAHFVHDRPGVRLLPRI